MKNNQNTADFAARLHRECGRRDSFRGVRRADGRQGRRVAEEVQAQVRPEPGLVPGARRQRPDRPDQVHGRRGLLRDVRQRPAGQAAGTPGEDRQGDGPARHDHRPVCHRTPSSASRRSSRRTRSSRIRSSTRMKEAVEVSKRTDAKWALIAPGCISQRMEVDYQTANLIDNVRRCVEIAEPAGVVIVLEPLNWWANHPGLFLQKIPQTYHGLQSGQQPVVQDRQRPVPPADHRGQPDPEHRQGLERDRRVPPGRQPRPQRARHRRDQLQEHLPAHLHKKGYQGVLCMEHGKSKRGKEGERAVIDAYRACDSFEV